MNTNTPESRATELPGRRLSRIPRSGAADRQAARNHVSLRFASQTWSESLRVSFVVFREWFVFPSFTDIIYEANLNDWENTGSGSPNGSP